MRNRSLLLKHVDVLAIAVVLLGYSVVTSAHTGTLHCAATAARTKIQRKIRPVHVDSRAYRWMRLARSLRVQMV